MYFEEFELFDGNVLEIYFEINEIFEKLESKFDFFSFKCRIFAVSVEITRK